MTLHAEALNRLRHNHNFGVMNNKGERRTRMVLVLTLLTMIIEIIAGSVYGSMALLADGWHMGTHVAAFIITLYAYRYARRHADDQTFAFSNGKVDALGGFASSVALGVVALIMLFESTERLLAPRLIQFDHALLVAGMGLFINFFCAILLKDSHHPVHEHTHSKHGHHGHVHHHNHSHQDYNLRAAYFHVLADALTSVLAILALFLGKLYGWNGLDPVMGIVGALIIARWSMGLLKETSPLLLDNSIGLPLKNQIRQIIEQDADNRIADLHVWRVGSNHFALIVSLVSHHPKPPEYYKTLLQNPDNYTAGETVQLSHITVEVNVCSDEGCIDSNENSMSHILEVPVQKAVDNL